MKQTKHFLRPLLMAIVMIAMSPMRAWAQEADPRMAVFNKLEGVTATFEDEGDYPWELTRYNGLDVLMNTNQGKDETTSTTTIKLACDQTIRIHFNYKTSSEASDYLKISVDGNEVVNSQYAEPDEDGIATVVGTYSSLLPANANGHTITMSYIKDISSSSGDDCGCIYFISAYTHQHYYNATSCDWSEDNTSATLHLKCECGETADVEATTITRTEEAPTCVKDGFCTITASAAYNGKTVTYSKTETFAALGHDWQVQSDGTYACQREGCTALSIEVIESSGGFEGEGPEKLFDGAPNTKWCGSDVENESNSFYVIFKPGKPSVLVSYSLVDAEDTEEEYYNRGWSSWDIQGTNDPNLEAWESISEEGGGYQGRTFTTGNTTAYTYYKITFSVYDSEDEYGEYYLQQMADMNITWCREHQWGEDHKCTVCGYECEHQDWEYGECTVCGYECKHKDSNEDDNCDICGIHAETFESLAALIAADQDYDAVNVTVDEEILVAMPHPDSDFSGMYLVALKSGVQLVAPIPEPALNWQSGGTIKGTLKYADWGETDQMLSSKDASFWSNLTYTPGVAKEYNSIDELLADENLENGTLVTVTVEGTIAETQYAGDMKMYQIVLDNGFVLGALEVDTDPGWKVGGTISGTLENVTFMKNDEAGEVVVGIMSLNRNIFAELNYIVPAVTIGETEIAIKLNSDGKYVAKENIVLTDGASFTANVEFTAPSDQVTVARTFTASKPASVMLPFSIDASLVQGATFSEFSGVSYDAEKAQWVATMTSVTTGNLQAYKPYIVILDADNATGKVTFDNTSADVATFVVTPDASAMQTADENGWTFQAVNTAKTWGADDPEIGKAYGFAGKDKTVDGNDIHRGDFVKIAAGASAKPGRCYLMKEGALTRATEELPATIKVRFIVGSATGIGTLDTETGEMTLEGWYDLNGNKIEQPSKGGVYINNNKKVMVK